MWNAEKGLVTLGRIPECAEVSSLDFEFDKSCLSIANYFIVIAQNKSWKSDLR